MKLPAEMLMISVAPTGKTTPYDIARKSGAIDIVVLLYGTAFDGYFVDNKLDNSIIG